MKNRRLILIFHPGSIYLTVNLMYLETGFMYTVHMIGSGGMLIV